MKSIFKIFYKISETIQVTSIWLAVIYVAIWCYRFFGLPYNMANPILKVIEFFVGIFRDSWNLSMEFSDRAIDMNYPIAIILLFVIYFVFINITSFFERAINDCEFEELKSKEIEEKLLNAELEENLKKGSLENNSFVALLELHLEHSVEQNVKTNHVNLEMLRNANNRQIINSIKVPYNTEGRIKNSKIIYSVENFDMFDDFLVILLENIKRIYRENKALNVQTSFTLSLDAAKSLIDINPIVSILEKIASFKYINRIVITTLFLSRYEYSPSHKFEARTMGVSRFFEKKSINLKGEIQFESEDFDLYSLKLKKT